MYIISLSLPCDYIIIICYVSCFSAGDNPCVLFVDPMQHLYICRMLISNDILVKINFTCWKKVDRIVLSHSTRTLTVKSFQSM